MERGLEPGSAGALARTVLVVDDDPSIRLGLQRLLGEVGYRVRTFASAEEFFANGIPEGPSCLLLDLHLPGADGMEIQATLGDRGDPVPIVFITGDADVRTSVRAMKNGAMDFFPKPLDPPALLEAIGRCFEREEALREERRERGELERRYELLTPREREVFWRVAGGMSNKRTAHELGITEKTVKVHRARAVAKLQAQSVAELAQIAMRLGAPPRRSPWRTTPSRDPPARSPLRPPGSSTAE